MKKSYLLLWVLGSIPCFAIQHPTMGWSSWNTYALNISEKLIKTQADAMVLTGLLDAGFEYINIDDGYFGGRDANGCLIAHPTKFPNGLKPVVDYIHQRGLKAGIYSDAGRNTCGNNSRNDIYGVGVGFYEHEQQDADFFFNEMDFDFVKVDYCGANASTNKDGLSLDEQERYTAIYQAIKNTKRKDAKMNVCRWNYPGTWVHDVSDSWRISHDIKNNWESVADIIKQSLYISAYAYDGKYNDMDMLEVGRSLSEEEDKTHFGIWCIMCSPLLIGCDLTQINTRTINLLKNDELIALNQDDLGLQAYVAQKTNDCYILVKDIITLYGNKRAIAVYNPTDTQKNITVIFSKLSLAGKIQVRDLFERKDIGEYSNSMEVSVPSHGTRIYTLHAERRTERTLYEAETAFISDYQEIKNNKELKTGIYGEAAYCSGGAKAKYLGYSEQNDLVWRNVHSIDGGDYDMTIGYMSGEDREIYISVNGKLIEKKSVFSGSYSTLATVVVPIHLEKGDNVIRLSNAYYWMPDIDFISLQKKTASHITPVQADNKNEDVYSINGIKMNEKAHDQEIPASLPKGIYIVGGKKMAK